MQRALSFLLAKLPVIRVLPLLVSTPAILFAGQGDAHALLSLSASELTATGPSEIMLRPDEIRVHTGDGADWMNPLFSDDSWSVAKGFERPSTNLPDADNSEPVWFRFKVRFAEDLLGRPLVLTAKPFQDHLQVFINGTMVAGPQDLDPSTRTTPRAVILLKTDNLFALRWTPNDRAPNFSLTNSVPTAFTLHLTDYDAVLDRFDRVKEAEFFYSGHRTALIALYAVFFLFFLALYANYRPHVESLYYALTSLTCAIALVALHVSEIYHYDREIWHISYLHCYLAFMILTILLGMAMLQVLLSGTPRPTLLFYALAGIVLYAMAVSAGNFPAYLLPLLMLPELAYFAFNPHGFKGRLTARTALAVFAMTIAMFSACACMGQWDSSSGYLRYAAWYFYIFFLMSSAAVVVHEYALDRRRIEAFASTLETEVEIRTRDLKAALAEIKTLKGIIPICMHCHKIRDDKESWQGLEHYIQEHSDAHFSHGLCPECFAEHYPDIAEDIRRNPQHK